YASSEELLGYCQNSANPVGRIILELHGIRHKEAMEYSDNICTALQLANFYQDISLDYEKGRIYIPKNELDKFGVSEEQFKQRNADEKFKSMLKSQTEAVGNMF
ncbi:MAG TPA: squalene/phytoene synthase family protein, partial [Ignavibacteriales bacterium]|nr:squalene/phytoene synthase family protein [Ignavibacteriales bacterium]